MISKSLVTGLLMLGAGISAAEATHIGNKAHVPVAGVELGPRLKTTDAPADAASIPKAEPVAAAADAAPARAERKVRVVYPLPR